jgi:AraC family transcriptional activator of pyochelin receptor
MKAQIDVSPEMLAFIGAGPLPADASWPAGAIGFGYHFGTASLIFLPEPDAVALAEADIAFVVSGAACIRIFGGIPSDAGCWHLPSDLRTIALAIQQTRLTGAAATTLRVAKCIELLCMTFESFGGATLIPASGAGAISAAEAQRIADARRLIDERWNEKLTLDSISRACGLNRAKLTRGFRSMFAMSVADAIADRRLGGARDMLLATDLPVSSIGYRCGYLNNASFTRAFSRRFGQAPTQFRSRQIAA